LTPSPEIAIMLSGLKGVGGIWRPPNEGACPHV
jgi:hypothetical protein